MTTKLSKKILLLQSSLGVSQLISQAFLECTRKRELWGKWLPCTEWVNFIKKSCDLPNNALADFNKTKLNRIIARIPSLGSLMDNHNLPNVFGVFRGKFREDGKKRVVFYYATMPNEGLPKIRFEAKKRVLVLQEQDRNVRRMCLQPNNSNKKVRCQELGVLSLKRWNSTCLEEFKQVRK